MRHRILSTVAFLLCAAGAPLGAQPARLEIYQVSDFEPQGMPMHQAWSRSASAAMRQELGDERLPPRFRIAYSENGLYLLVECADRRLSATLEEDFSALWQEDSVGLVLGPREESAAFFEYVVSPLDRETALFPDRGAPLGDADRAAEYAGERQVKKRVLVLGEATLGRGKPNQEKLEGWIAELFIPYALLQPVLGEKPRAGDVWRVSLYRVDYDGEEPALWSWPEGDHPLGERRGFGELVFR